MALIEDMLKGNLTVAVAMGATALLLPKVFPYLSPQLRSAVTGGLSLFLESEYEAEGGIVDRLAETALSNVLHRLSEPGPKEERHEAAQAVVENFKHRAHVRARRYGRDHAEQRARYKRHVSALDHKLNRALVQHGHRHGDALQTLAATLHSGEDRRRDGGSG